MNYFTNELTNIFIFVIASLVLALILFVAVYIMSFTSKVEFEKSSAYECGFAPFSETSYPFEVQFALIAIMFLLFDIEVLYLYPLVTSILDLSFSDLIGVIIFFATLTVGIIFEISKRIMLLTPGEGLEGFSKGISINEKYDMLKQDKFYKKI